MGASKERSWLCQESDGLVIYKKTGKVVGSGLNKAYYYLLLLQ